MLVIHKLEQSKSQTIIQFDEYDDGVQISQLIKIRFAKIKIKIIEHIISDSDQRKKKLTFSGLLGYG